MPVLPNVIEQLILLRLNQGPGPLLDLFGAGAFRVAVSAVKLGIFNALAQRPLTGEELAHHIGINEQAAATILATLDAFGYVKRTRHGRYINTPGTAKWLLSDSPSHLADFLLWWHQLVFTFWDQHFEAIMRDGRPPLTIYAWLESQPDGWNVAQAGFEATARLVIEDVVTKIDVPRGSTRALDVGGGHGLYSIALCRRHPEITATVFDLPAALERAKANSHASGLRDRVQIQPGDYREDDLGSNYDVALVFNVIHAHQPEENIRLLKKVAAALAPQGRVVILDQMDATALGPMTRAANSLIGLAYFTLLSGQTFPYTAVASWLSEAGFAVVSQKRLPKAPGTSMIVAVRNR
jgi:2-polyprenyl-3-methyl-5-hydroxy-6-metoxy-1,4-benzoquinol methylase